MMETVLLESPLSMSKTGFRVYQVDMLAREAGEQRARTPVVYRQRYDIGFTVRKR